MLKRKKEVIINLILKILFRRYLKISEKKINALEFYNFKQIVDIMKSKKMF